MMPFHDPRFPGDGKARQFQLVLRRRPDGKDLEIDSDAREELVQIIAYLEALRDGEELPGPAPEIAPDAGTGDAKPPPPAPPRLTLPGNRNSLARKFKLARVRLGSKINSEPPLSRKDILEEVALLTDSNLFADDPEEPEPDEPPQAPAPKPTPPAAAPAGRGGWLFALTGVAILAALGWAAVHWMRPATPSGEEHPAASNPSAEAAISDEALRTAEIVLHSVQLGKLETASGALADASKHGVVLPGLHYQAALLAIQQGDARAGTDWLAQSIAAREFVPECLYLRANAAGSVGDYAAACDLFAEAAGYAAFSPRYFFFWGEALRRVGHSAQALAQFERALLCRPSSTDADLIRFKMGLAQVEAGADEKSDPDLQSVPARKNVSGDALLLAAAVEINREAYPAAAAYLQRAKGVMPPALLAGRLRDFVFRSQARQADLAVVWPVVAPASSSAESSPTARPRVVVVDPATRSLAEADPAVW